MTMRIGPQLLKLPTLNREQEVLTVLEDIFPLSGIRRLFWFKGLNSLTKRGNHAHKKCTQLFIPMYGTCAIEYRQPRGVSESILLSAETNKALLVPPFHWVRLIDCSDNAVVLVVTDELYSEEDFIRSEAEFDQYE